MFKITICEVKIIPDFMISSSIFLLSLVFVLYFYSNMEASDSPQIFGREAKEKVEDFQRSLNEFQREEDNWRPKRRNLIHHLRSVADDLDKHKKE